MRFLSNITAIEGIVEKAQGFAHQYKERKIRKHLREIRVWENNIEFIDVWSVFILWFKKHLRSIRAITG
jgi:hypothetical protein